LEMMTTTGVASVVSYEIEIKKSNLRSIDDYYDEIYEKSPKSCQFRFWLIFLSLGLANSGDAVEVNLMNFLLGDDGFREEILKGDLSMYGGWVSASGFAGMLIGGIYCFR